MNSAVVKRLNDLFDECFIRKEDNGKETFSAPCCFSCDHLLDPFNIKLVSVAHILKHRNFFQTNVELDPLLKECYKFSDTQIKDDLSDMLLSPRCSVIKNKSKLCLSCCNDCHAQIFSSKRRPTYGIANGHYCGTPPKVLTDLNDAELYFLTPVRAYGICFGWTGGGGKFLKGSVTFYKIDMASVAEAVTKFDVLEMLDTMVVVYYDEITQYQKKHAQERSTIRPRKVLLALEWLLHHHAFWKKQNIDLDDVRTKLHNPQVVDHSEIVESETGSGNNAEQASNIERTSEFTVYFPDNSLNDLDGGEASHHDFKQRAAELKLKEDYNLSAHCEMPKVRVPDYAGENFILANLLAFPFGHGGIDEEREYFDDQKILDYIQHLSMMSQPQFHEEKMVLIMYHMTQKQKVVESAFFKMRNKKSASYVANDMKIEHVIAAVKKRNSYCHAASEEEKNAFTFLGAVDTITGSIAHSNRATRAARRDVEAYTHNFGNASHFLTVNPDDNHSLLIQIYSGKDIDLSNTKVENLSDEELAKRFQQRQELRVSCPGLCAFIFDLVMRMIKTEIIGWYKPGREGLLGTCEAYTQTVEEQGRKTLHAHFLVWCRRFNELRESLYDNFHHTTAAAETEMVSQIDRLCSTRFFSLDGYLSPEGKLLQNIFPHSCTEKKFQNRFPPKVVNLQGLRDLRHRQAPNCESVYFAKCPHCQHTWQNEDLVNDYLLYGVQVPSLTGFPDGRVQRLKAMCLQYQKQATTDCTLQALQEDVVNAACNIHIHQKLFCFKYFYTKKRKRNNDKHAQAQSCASPLKKRKYLEECRAKYPSMPSTKTSIKEVPDQPESGSSWINFDGSVTTKKLREIVLNRNPYDAFINSNLTVLTNSKWTGNNNYQALLACLVACYVTKYCAKETQEEDTREFKKLILELTKILGYEKDPERSDMSQAMRRLIRAALQHNSANIIGGPMASFLTRKQSRFEFSHDLVWCPLRDLLKLLKMEDVYMGIITSKVLGACIKCSPLDYLCRPLALEKVVPLEFYRKYCTKVVSNQRRRRSRTRNTTFIPPKQRRPVRASLRMTKTKWKNGIWAPYTNSLQEMEFVNTDQFIHPSHSKKNNKKAKFRLVCQERPNNEELPLIKVFQYDFPDASTFGGCIKDENITKNTAMETYSAMALTLLHHYRKLDDIQKNGSYTEKFRELLLSGSIPENHQKFLQNIQDAKVNNWNHQLQEDHLARSTNPPCFDGKEITYNSDNDTDEESDPNKQLENISKEAEQQMSSILNSVQKSNEQCLQFKHLNLYSFRCKSRKGKKSEAPTLTLDTSRALNTETSTPIIHNQEQGCGNQQNNATDVSNSENGNPSPHNTTVTEPTDFSQVLKASVLQMTLKFKKTWRRTVARKRNSSSGIKETEELSLDYPEANGTPKSIVLWANIANLDKVQTIAFEVIMSSFLLTYYGGQHTDVDLSREELQEYTNNIHYLRLMSRKKHRHRNLVCLLHGPGGSGKSTIISLVLAYAERFCSHIPGYQFTKNTIVVCAYSGVAATLLMGKTMHSALHTRKKRITEEMMEEFSDTRMIIFDEVSFAPERDHKDILRSMGDLKDTKAENKPYGGVEMIFAGDFRQMHPVKALPIYRSQSNGYYFERHINCYIELTGKHRFKQDPKWGEVLTRFRDGELTAEDMDYINSREVKPGQKLPQNIQFAVHENQDKDRLNTLVFHEETLTRSAAQLDLTNTLLVLAGDVKIKDIGTDSYYDANNFYPFFQKCSEDDIKYTGLTKTGGKVEYGDKGRVDPLLKLRYGCRVMVSQNINVDAGIAKGTRATIVGVQLKKNVVPFSIGLINDNGVTLDAVRATDIEYITLRHENEDILPATFQMSIDTYNAFVELPVQDEHKIYCRDTQIMSVKFKQFPFTLNDATTVHKLQGSSVDTLYIYSWFHEGNWIYVALSRVRTHSGLFLKEPLKIEDLKKYAVDPKLKQMLQDLEQFKPEPLPDSYYTALT